MRRTYDDEGTSAYLDVHSDGVIDFGFRIAPRTDEQLLALGWVVAYTVNVLRTAEALRTAAGAPDCEYGIEVELHGKPAADPVGLISWNERSSFDNRIGRGLQRLPLSLPRLSFGPAGELDQIVSLLANDLCDAVGAYYPQPLSLSIDPSYV